MRVLVTGASGYIAGYLLRSIPKNVFVTAAKHHKAPPVSSAIVETVALDLTQSVGPQLKNQQFDVVIHLAAMANLQRCEEQPRECMRVNFETTRELAEYCELRGIFFIFISTDIVFSGKHAPYAFDAVPHPINIYGQSKRNAEKAIMACHGPHAILRLALLLGQGLNNAGNFIDWFIDSSKRAVKIPLFTDEIRTPLWTTDAARAIWRVAENRISGVHHLCGDRKLDRLGLGNLLMTQMNGNPDLLKPVLSAELPVNRPLNVALRAGNTIPAFSFEEGLKKYFGNAYE